VQRKHGVQPVEKTAQAGTSASSEFVADIVEELAEMPDL